ncbi:MAG: thioredoxin family protein [Muribaculaceae bacterium]|nr:thioredoxin family protein [Muribaculaceae bacterium]
MKQKKTSLSSGVLSLMMTAIILLAAGGQIMAKPMSTHATWKAEIIKVSDREGIVRVTGTVEDGWHVYGTVMPEYDEKAAAPDPTTLTILPTKGVTVMDADKPAECSEEASVHFDEIMQLNLPWLTGTFTLSRSFRLDDGVNGATISGEVGYMSCSSKACISPSRYEFSLPFGTAEATAASEPEEAAEATGGHDALIKSAGGIPAEKIAQWWEPVETEAHSTSQSYWLIFIFGFLGGLVALLTPCVWPMIPMTMSFFLKGKKSRRRSIADAVSYALSIIVIFLLLGIVITLIFGPGKLNEIATSAVFNVLFFLILVVFALSFLGAFEITLPAKWSNAMDAKAEKTTGFVSIFFMAFTLVLVSFSCTGPIIGTLLVEAFSEGNLMGPLLGMGGFALGLALPFGVFAFFPSMMKELPRSGSWLNTVKVVLGFIELILSLKFLSVADLAYGWGILDREIFLAIWIVLFILLGMYLLGKLRFPHDEPSEGPERTGIFRFFLAVCSLSFAVYLLPGMWGAPLKGISAFAPPLYTQDFNLYGGEFKEYDNYEEGMAAAAEQKLPVLLDFSGYACVNCRKMEGAVFDTPAVRDMIEGNYVMIKLMVDDKTALPENVKVDEGGQSISLRTVGDKWSYLERHKFGINSQPYYVLLDNDGEPLTSPRAYNESIDAFLEWLQTGIENYKTKK